MNKELKQMLLNQVAIMRCLRWGSESQQEVFEICLQKTSQLLNPKQEVPYAESLFVKSISEEKKDD